MIPQMLRWGKGDFRTHIWCKLRESPVVSKLAISMANSSGAMEIMEGLIVLAEWGLAIEQN